MRAELTGLVPSSMLPQHATTACCVTEAVRACPTPPNPAQINTEPYGEGWMIKVKLTNKGQVDKLMDADAYTSFCEGQ